LPGKQNCTVLLLGAGGAGRAVARALLNLGVPEVLIFDTDARRARDLVSLINHGVPAGSAAIVENLEAAVGRCEGIVNASPVGMAKYPGLPLPESALTARHWVADIVYFPERTELVKLAEALGCPTLRGTGMAVFQAAKSFELFSGLSPDKERMMRSYKFTAPGVV
jgi:shikimate dehydrogenase